MLKVFRDWIHRHFSEEEAIVLFLLLALGLTVVITMGGMLAPVFAGLGIAFILQGAVNSLERHKVPQYFAVILVFLVFLAVFMAIILLMLPLIWEQVTTLLNELPGMLRQGQYMLMKLPDEYPGFVSPTQVSAWLDAANRQIAGLGQWALSFSLSKLPGVVSVLIYLVLVPILVFFFLKDRLVLLNWLSGFLPRERRLINQVAEEMSLQIANYIRGKFIEIVIVGVASFIAFAFLGLNYSVLLGVLVGLSVVIPYIGAAVVTIPVAIIALFQWGWGHEFMVLMGVYGVIQALDGNMLVPLLFSEAVNLHPIAIIVAVLVFGGLWGFWGVFFAIPLATLIKAVITAWPSAEDFSGEPEAEVQA